MDRGPARKRLAAKALPVVVAILVSSCGASGGTSSPLPKAGVPVQTIFAVSPSTISSTAGHALPRCTLRHGIVLRINDGNPADSYVLLSPSGNRQCSLGVPGYKPAGFSKDLTRVATADEGALGSGGHVDTWLYVGPANGKHLAKIWTVENMFTTVPAWSPSGNTLAFGLQRTESRTDQIAPGAVRDGLWRIDSDGHGPSLLAAGEITSVAWSRDGSRIAFALATPTGFEIATLPEGGGNPIVLGQIATGRNDPSLAWSPDSTRILVAYNNATPTGTTFLGGAIEAYPTQGGNPTVVVPQKPNTIYDGLTFSPDGRYIAVAIQTQPPPSLGTSVTTPIGSGGPIGFGSYIEAALPDGSQTKIIANLESSAQIDGWF